MRVIFVIPTLLITLLLLPSCVSIDHSTDQPVNTEYCDHYITYPMCAKDMTDNGEIDFMYFPDTNEVFMIAEDINQQTKSQLTLHQCLQVMDKDMRSIASQLLYIDEQTSSSKKMYIKSNLILAYTRYMHKVNSCHNPDAESLSTDTEFGEEDFDDLLQTN